VQAATPEWRWCVCLRRLGNDERGTGRRESGGLILPAVCLLTSRCTPSFCLFFCSLQISPPLRCACSTASDATVLPRNSRFFVGNHAVTRKKLVSTLGIGRGLRNCNWQRPSTAGRMNPTDMCFFLASNGRASEWVWTLSLGLHKPQILDLD